MIADTELPPTVTGRYLVITHPDSTTTAYPIVAIRRCEATEQPGIEIDEDPGFIYTDADSGQGPAAERASRLTRYPETAWTGPHTFRIDNAVTASFPPA